MWDSNSYGANPQLNNLEESVVKEGASLKADKKLGPWDIELCSIESKKIHGEISEVKHRPSSKREARFRSILDEQLYNDRNPNESFMLNDDTSVANIGYFEGGKIQKNLLAKDEIQQEVMLEKGMDVFQVVGKGTQFMNSISMPTIIVELLSSLLDKSMVYYLIMELETEKNPRNVPAVMFSNPYAHRKTRYAELLPLCWTKSSKSLCLAPLLRRKRYRRIFRRGVCFKVKSLLPGRAFNSTREHLWNMYDIRKKGMQNVLKELIELDICQLSLHLRYNLTPLKHISKRCKDMRNGIWEQTVPVISEIRNHEEREITQEIAHHKSSSFRMSNKIPEVSKGGYSFSKCLIVRPSKQKRKKIQTQREILFHVTQISILGELDKYFCISGIV